MEHSCQQMEYYGNPLELRPGAMGYANLIIEKVSDTKYVKVIRTSTKKLCIPGYVLGEQFSGLTAMPLIAK